MQGFIAMMKELQDLAGQHDYIAESLSKLVLKDVQTAIQEMKQERKRVNLNYHTFCCLCFGFIQGGRKKYAWALITKTSYIL